MPLRENMEEIIRKKYCFTGRVQGVGFRYRAIHSASMLGVTGWVQNDWDGSVKMEAQGTRDQLERLLEMIGNGRYIEIEAFTAERIPVQEDERGFSAGRNL